MIREFIKQLRHYRSWNLSWKRAIDYAYDDAKRFWRAK